MGRSAIDATARKNLFLNGFARTGTILTAAKHAGIERQTHYNWMESDEDYKRRFKDAQDNFVESLEAELFRRATRKKAPSDVDLIFAIKKHRPEYRENYKVELGNAGGGSLSLDVHFVDPPDATGEG